MNTPLLAPPSVSRERAKVYAERSKAKRLDQVYALIDELYRLGELVGIDPAILVAQSAHETGDPSSGRGWQSPAWETRLNPAGLGITDARDFGYRWESGTEAAQALLVHHAAYIFGELPPALRPYRDRDPRYDAVLQAGYGASVRYLEEYGNGKWASDPQYAQKIRRKLAELLAIVTTPEETSMPNIYDWWLHEPRKVGGTTYPAVYRYYANRAGYQPKVIVLHIQQGTNLGSWIHFHNVTASSTVMIAKNGDIWRVVPEHHAPWTNGDVCSPTKKGASIMNEHGWDPNYYTLSIETEGFTDEWPKPQAQLDSVLWQIRDWMKRYNIPKSMVVRHADFNQCSRARCPGDTYYQWIMERLEDPISGLLVYAQPQPVLVNGQPWDGKNDVTVNGITFYADQREVTVAKDELRAHKWAAKEAPLTRAPLQKGERFSTLGWVRGEKIGDEDRWWISKYWSRIWVGGTVEKPTERPVEAPPPRGDTAAAEDAPRTRFGLIHYRAAPDGNGRMVTCVKQAVVRKVPLTGTEVVANVNPGDQLLALEWTRAAHVHGEDIWWRVKLSDGSIGYLWVAATDARPY